jgi:hypothetical protein
MVSLDWIVEVAVTANQNSWPSDTPDGLNRVGFIISEYSFMKFGVVFPPVGVSPGTALTPSLNTAYTGVVTAKHGPASPSSSNAAVSLEPVKVTSFTTLLENGVRVVTCVPV